MRAKDAVFYAIPGAIAVVAAIFAWRAFHGEHEGPERPEGPPKLALMCPSGRFRCSKGEVRATTGEEKPEGADGGAGCAERSVARCARACVSESIALEGVDDDTAKTQLCDPPPNVEPMIARVMTIVELGDDGGTCVADGWGPSEDGVLECILRSAKDPDALGVVVSRVTCKTAVIPTMDKTPRIVERDQAIAAWCARSNAALLDAGVSLDASPTNPMLDAGADADADADTRGSDADARHD